MAYLKKVTNVFGEVIRLEHLPVMNMRRKKGADQYCMVGQGLAKPISFNVGEVIQFKEYDVNQQIYGVPQYLDGATTITAPTWGLFFIRPMPT